MRKLTIEISEEDFQVVMDNLHHGQLSAITRLFMANVAKRMKDKEKSEIMNWLYGKKNLTLKSKGGLDDSN